MCTQTNSFFIDLNGEVRREGSIKGAMMEFLLSREEVERMIQFDNKALAAMFASNSIIRLCLQLKNTGFNNIGEVFDCIKEYNIKNCKNWTPTFDSGLDCNGNNVFKHYTDVEIEEFCKRLITNKSSSGTNSLKTSKPYINLWDMFCINVINCHYNETDKINAYFISMGIDINDPDKCRDFMFQWLIDELVAVHSDLTSALLELKSLKQSTPPNPAPGSFTIDSGTLVACLEDDKQKLEARLAKANAALKAAGLEEV